MVDPLAAAAAVDRAISLVKRLREISKNIAEAEFKNVLADLLNELGDAKVQVASLKNKLAAQMEEVRALKAATPEGKEKPVWMKYGCYEFDGDEKLYCVVCYEAKGVKSPTSRVNVKWRRCLVCEKAIPAG